MIPRHDGLQPARETALRSLKASGNAIQVLVIEDDVEMSAEIIACLAASGFQPKPCFDGAQGLGLALSGRFDAITQNKALALKVGDLELDLMAREAWRHGRPIELLPMEFKLLEFMMRNVGQMLSRRMIFEHVWEYNFDPGTNLIDVHIGRLRKKIDAPGKASFIRTERGTGYVFNAV
jgi:two-component system OmpR family response regulator